jgi:quinol-cytochrome oxidoreductase complex cytochrome b subunit
MLSFLLHFHPKKINPAALKFTRTFGLGGMAVLLFVLEALTGILLRFYYIPTTFEAYQSIVNLNSQVLFGQFIRNIHYWGSILLILTTFLHFLRVFFTSAYRDARAFNWIIGLLMLVTVFMFNFSGYLLPWDQLAYWAVTVVTNILLYIPWVGESFYELIIGGKELNSNTLHTFFAFHTALLPFVLLLLLFYHIWKVRKAGGIILEEQNQKSEKVDVMPHLVHKEGIVALVIVALLFVLALIFDAPLLEKANPTGSINPVKAPWYFAGLQELLLHFDPIFAAILIPMGILLFLVWIPYFNYDKEPTGKWFLSEKGKNTTLQTAIFSFILTILGILLSPGFVRFEKLLPGFPGYLSNGLIPITIMVGLVWLFFKYRLHSSKLLKEEKIQAIFVFILVAFVILTLTGIFFRGKNMELMMPWNI